MSDDRYESERRKTLRIWRYSGRHLLSELGLRVEPLRKELLDLIKASIHADYAAILPLDNQLNERVTDIAKRWLMYPGEASRILSGDRGLSFAKACLICAAEKIDFPSGLSVGLAAHRTAFVRMLERTKLEGDVHISDRTLLTLYLAARSPEWRAATLSEKDAEKIAAAKGIATKLADYLPGGSELDWTGLQSTVTRHARSWSVWEALIEHEWY